ncbi:MAG: nuclear transport factor 2 family protein [Chloroflexi bacterium]|nr:nuclear transport factor 2 family protein [Chloroflexota bacterium]
MEQSESTQVVQNRQLVEQFWATMNSNDFRAAAELFHDDYVLEWPQSGERIRGRENFVAINDNYPAAGRWHFTIHRLIADESGTASEVTVTDGAITARVVTFSEFRDGKIVYQVEYWSDPFEAAAWRAEWVERM